MGQLESGDAGMGVLGREVVSTLPFILCVLFPALAAAAPDAGTPASTNSHVAAGFSSFEQGMLNAAEQELLAALANENNTPEDELRLHLLDGMLRAVSADDDLARAAFGRALQLNPNVALPAAATTRVRRVFGEARQEQKARAAGQLSLTSQVAKLTVEGKLDGAEALISGVGDRKDLSQAESSQLFVLKGVVMVLRGLQAAGTAEGVRARAARDSEQRLQEAEQQLAAGAKAVHTETESAQQLVLKGMLLMLKGLVKAEAGDEAQANAAFSKALELDPGATLPAGATPRAQRLFAEAKAAAPPPPSGRDLPRQISRLYGEGKLDQAELLLARSGEREDLSKAEAAQISVLKGLLLVLKGLQKVGPREEDRARVASGAEGQLRAVEESLGAVASVSTTDAEAAQRLVLKGLVLMVKGLAKAESGEEAQAKAAFARALELDPDATLPSAGAPKVQQLFKAAKAVAVPASSEPRGLPERLSGLFADGRLERAELVLAENGARKDLSRFETGQVLVLKGMLQILKGLQAAGPSESEATKVALAAERPMKELEARVVAGADAPFGEAEAAQQRWLKSLFHVVQGVLKAESGDAAQARTAFEQGLAEVPSVRLPAVATPSARKQFEAVRSSAGLVGLTPGPAPWSFLFVGKDGPLRRTGWGLVVGGSALTAGGVAATITAFAAPRLDQRTAAGVVAAWLYIGAAVTFEVGALFLWLTQSDAGMPPAR